MHQLDIMRRLRGEEAIRGLLVGLSLLRIKASLSHGQFTPWMKKHFTWSDRYARYMMQLGLVFVEKTRAKKPEILALPGEQTELAIDGMEGVQRQIFAKAQKFVGDLSLAELFEKHGIKETKKLGGKRTKGGDDDETPATPEQLAQQTRDEIGTAIQTLEQLLITENRLQYVVGDGDFIQGTVESLEMIATKTAALVAQLTKPAKPAKAA